MHCKCSGLVWIAKEVLGLGLQWRRRESLSGDSISESKVLVCDDGNSGESRRVGVLCNGNEGQRNSKHQLSFAKLSVQRKSYVGL